MYHSPSSPKSSAAASRLSPSVVRQPTSQRSELMKIYQLGREEMAVEEAKMMPLSARLAQAAPHAQPSARRQTARVWVRDSSAQQQPELAPSGNPLPSYRRRSAGGWQPSSSAHVPTSSPISPHAINGYALQQILRRASYRLPTSPPAEDVSARVHSPPVAAPSTSSPRSTLPPLRREKSWGQPQSQVQSPAHRRVGSQSMQSSPNYSASPMSPPRTITVRRSSQEHSFETPLRSVQHGTESPQRQPIPPPALHSDWASDSIALYHSPRSPIAPVPFFSPAKLISFHPHNSSRRRATLPPPNALSTTKQTEPVSFIQPQWHPLPESATGEVDAAQPNQNPAASEPTSDAPSANSVQPSDPVAAPTQSNSSLTPAPVAPSTGRVRVRTREERTRGLNPASASAAVEPSPPPAQPAEPEPEPTPEELQRERDLLELQRQQASSRRTTLIRERQEAEAMHRATHTGVFPSFASSVDSRAPLSPSPPTISRAIAPPQSLHGSRKARTTLKPGEWSSNEVVASGHALFDGKAAAEAFNGIKVISDASSTGGLSWPGSSQTNQASCSFTFSFTASSPSENSLLQGQLLLRLQRPLTSAESSSAISLATSRGHPHPEDAVHATLPQAGISRAEGSDDAVVSSSRRFRRISLGTDLGSLATQTPTLHVTLWRCGLDSGTASAELVGVVPLDVTALLPARSSLLSNDRSGAASFPLWISGEGSASGSTSTTEAPYAMHVHWAEHVSRPAAALESNSASSPSGVDEELVYVFNSSAAAERNRAGSSEALTGANSAAAASSPLTLSAPSVATITETDLKLDVLRSPTFSLAYSGLRNRLTMDRTPAVASAT